MADLVFYTNPQSRGRIVRWMLEEVGVPYTTEVLDYATTMKTAEYLAINPMGKVPTIKHGDAIVTECAAICAYLAAAFPEADLGPTAAEQADYYRWLFFAAGPVESAVTNKRLAVDVPADQRMSIGYGDYDSVIETLAWAVTRHDYICGDRFTAADVYVGSQVGFGIQFGLMDPRDEFTAYWGRLSERAAQARATELDNALIPAEG